MLVLGVVVLASATLLGLYGVIVVLRVPSVAGLGQSGDPGDTAFMASDGCAERRREYTPLDDIDPRLVCAVVWAEDWRFFQHDGVDWRAFEGALRSNWERGELRLGGSSIAMQVARNLYLSRSRTPSRKLRELVLAPRLVARYGRVRILEVYLNAAEWAPCVYGAQAAARHYLGHGADRLDPAEAALLATTLPRPGHRLGATDDDRLRSIRRQQTLITTMGRAGLLSSGAMRRARTEVFQLMSRTRLEQMGSDTAAPHEPITRMPAPSDWLARACGTVRHETEETQ